MLQNGWSGAHTCMHDYDLIVYGIATESTQVIGMSATLSNIDEIAQFLRAEIYSDDFRPVSQPSIGIVNKQYNL